MNINQFTLVSAFVSVMLMLNSGIVSAQDDTEITDEQYCAQEAERSGMLSEQDIQAYVSQCMDEIRVQKELDSDLGSDFNEGDASSD